MFYSYDVGYSLIAQLVKNLPAKQETLVRFLGRKDPLEKWGRLPTPVFLGFPCGLGGKESPRNVGDLGSIPWLGRSPADRKGCPLQYSGLENSMESQRFLQDWATFTFHGTSKWGYTEGSWRYRFGAQEKSDPEIAMICFGKCTSNHWRNKSKHFFPSSFTEA